MNTLSLITSIVAALNTLGLVGGSMWFIRENKRQKRAEAAQVETNTAIAAGNEWQEIAEKWEARDEKMNAKMDNIYSQLSDWRDKYNEKVAENTDLKVKAANTKPRICNKRGCKDRKPQSGF